MLTEEESDVSSSVVRVIWHVATSLVVLVAPPMVVVMGQGG